MFVTTADVRGAGTDANVYIVLYGANDDTGLWTSFLEGIRGGFRLA